MQSPEQIDEKARQIYLVIDTTGHWDAEDEITRGYYRTLALSCLAQNDGDKDNCQRPRVETSQNNKFE